MLRLLLRNVLRPIETTTNVICTNSLCTKISNNNTKNKVLHTFEDGECERILDVLNNTNLEDLLRYEITKARARKLHTWRLQNGALKSIDDILLVEGFTHKTADSLFKSCLLDASALNSTRTDKRARPASFVTPSLDEEFAQKVRTCLSIRVGVSSVTWARLELGECQTDATLTHWQHYDIEQKKMHLHELIRHCLYAQDCMPTADCYIFENPQMAQANKNTGNADQQNVNINRAQMTAVLGYACAARSPSQPQVHYMRRLLSARLFNTLIGTERVSSEDAVLHLMHVSDNESNAGCHLDTIVADDGLDNRRKGSVIFPRDLQQMFEQSERAQREFLGQVLLLNLAFVRLVLWQDARSLAVITAGGNKIKEKS